MIQRVLTTCALVLAALTVLAWPLSRLGVTYREDRGGVGRSVSIADGRMTLCSLPVTYTKLLDRDRFAIATGEGERLVQFGPRLVQAKTRLWPGLVRSAGPIEITIPLFWFMGLSLVVLALCPGVPWAKKRRRARRGLCLCCGYVRAGGDAPCSECGVSPADAAARARTPIGRMVRDAGVGLFAVLLILCCGAWVVVQADRHAEEVLRARAFDYSWYLEVCQPRLNGRVICAQPGPGPDSLESLWMRAAPGTTIVLLPGEHSLGDVRTRGRTAGGVKDIWLLGSGAESTTLSLRLESARGVRIEGVTIDCNNTEFADFRDEGSLYLRNCRITNYNSGAGGSNAVFAVGSALLIESCEFEGKSGRASASMRGTAMDLRGRNIVYIRDTEFINNQEVFRNGDGVLDGCTVSTDQPQYYGPPSGDLYVRNTEAPSSRFPANAWKKFSQGLDDLDVLRAIADVRGRSATAWSDPVASEIAGTLGLQRDRGYWVRLLRHPSAEVRRLAAERAGAEYPAPELPVEKAVEALNQTVVSPEAALALMSGGEGARAKLKALVETGAAREKANAAAILRVMDAEPPLLDFLRYEKIRGAK